jgi:hypothetical protein
MKKAMLAVLLLCVGAVAFSQVYQPSYDSFVPRTLTAGTVMSGRTAATTYNDTTRPFVSRGYAAIYVGVETATNDTIDPIYIAYQVSKDGTTFGDFAVLDSAKLNGVVGAAKYFALPANVLGARQTRVRVYGTGAGAYSGPPATVTTRIVRALFGTTKVQ